MIRVEAPDQTTVGVQEAAVALGVSTMTIRRMIKRGDLQAVMVKGRTGREWRIVLDPKYRENRKQNGTHSNQTANGPQVYPGAPTSSELLGLVRELHAKVERLHEEKADLLAKLARCEERLDNS